MRKRSLVMAVKFSYVHKEDVIATRITEGYYKDIVYQVGRIQFAQPDELVTEQCDLSIKSLKTLT